VLNVQHMSVFVQSKSNEQFCNLKIMNSEMKKQLVLFEFTLDKTRYFENQDDLIVTLSKNIFLHIQNCSGDIK